MKFYAIITSIVLFIFLSIYAFIEIKKEPIKVGVIHSLSGTMASSEKPVLDATLFAIEQINASGGLLGRKIEVSVVDGKSSDDGFKEAIELLMKNNVKTVFGGWTSASRKIMKPILEKHGGLLFYPVQYEGFESSENIIYLGLSPNQQIIPTINYAVENFGNRVFLVGSDYIFPRIANEFIQSVASSTNLQIVGEEYALLGSDYFDDIAQKIAKERPSFILNTINGDSNIAFFKALQDAKIDLKEIPVFSLSLDESGVKDIADKIGVEPIKNSYSTWGYFDSIESDKNRALKKLFKERFKKDIFITDPMYSAYYGVKLWEKIVNKHQTFDSIKIKSKLAKESISTSTTPIYICEKNNHAWRNVFIAKVDENGDLNVLWDASSNLKPNPFPEYIDSTKILSFIDELYKKWNNKYEAHKGDAHE